MTMLRTLLSSAAVARALALGSAAALATGVGAHAQTPAEEPTSLEEIVVTAQRREEKLQDVPISVAAVTGDVLRKQDITNPVDLKYVVPGLNYSPSANVRGEGFSVRGIGTAVFSDSIEQSVGTVVDGVPYARTGQAVADLLDIDRIEVLRGPQGYLFGKNASAGVVSITTKRPTFAPSFDGRVSYGSNEETKFNLVGNLPLGDSLAIRVGAASTRADGIVKNVYTGETLNGKHSQVAVAKLLWTPTDDASLYISADYGRTATDCCAWTMRSAPLGTQLGNLNAAAGVRPGAGNLEMAADQPFYQHTQTRGVSAEVNYDLGWAELTSVTALRRWAMSDNNDPDVLPFNFLTVNYGSSHLEQVSEELRLTSPGDQPFSWIAGLYVDRIENRSRNNQTGGLNLGLPPGFLVGNAIDSVTTNKSAAAFGQVSYNFTDRLKLSAGARYTHDELSMNFRRSQAPGTIGPFGTLGTLEGDVNSDNLSGRVTLQYNFTPDIMVYGMAGRGYKGPGLNTLTTTGAGADLVRPEYPTAFELGVRSRIFSGTTYLNVTAFSTNVKDYQAQVFDQTIVPAVFRITNAGELETKGVEFEVLSKPARDTLVSFSGAYIDAKYADFKNISCYLGQPILPVGTPRTSPRQCIAVTPTQAVTNGDGEPLINQPKFSYNASIQQGWQVGDMTLQGRANWIWRDKVNFSANGDPNTVQGAYGLLGASLSVEPGQGPWRLTVFGKNLLDQHFVSFIFPSPVMGAPGVYAQFPSPEAYRTVGVAIDVRF